MRRAKRRGVIGAVVALVVVALVTVACEGGAGPAGPTGPAGKLAVYTKTTAELPIPNTPPGEGNLQQDLACNPGDLAIGGGHIIHPSSTTDVFVTKSYATDATGAFAPAAPDRWRGKVLNPKNLTEKKFTVHVVCADVTP